MIRRLLRSTLFPYTTLFRSLENPFGNVEVRVDVLNVVVLFERVHEAQKLAGGGLVLDLDGRPRNHGQVGRLDLDSRSEEHTSELQSRLHLVCRLLLEKKKKN